MSSEKSADLLDINGLAIFKESIVKKYLKQGEAPSVVGRAIYRALQQYKKDVVRFYASYSSLPSIGNPGTLYFIHKSVDKEHDDLNTKYEEQIWFAAPGAYDYIYCKYNNSMSALKLYKNAAGYYVLNLSDINQSNFNWLTVYTPYYSYSYNVCMPNTATQIVTYEQLSSLSGKILGVQGGTYGNGYTYSAAVEIPRYTYTGELPDQYKVPDDEIWVLSDNPTLRVRVQDYNTNYIVITERNQYGYFVLKKNIHTPPTVSSNSFNLYLDGYGPFCKIEHDSSTPVRFSYKSHYDSLFGHIVVKAKLDNIVMLYVIYPYSIDNEDIISSAPQDMSDNKFVIYTWVNGKYRQLSSAIFDTGDLHLERITDQVLSLTSHKAISNKAFCDALKYKFSIANILETPVAGYDNPVASKGIKAALDRLVTWEDIECIPITDEEIHTLFTTHAPIPLESANYYRIVIRGVKSEGANYLSKIFDVETLEGLTFSERSPDGPSLSETLVFIEDDTDRHIPVTISCANKYNVANMFYPGDLFDQNTDGYYRADTSADDLVLTIDIRRHLAMSTLRKLTFRCLAGRPYQTAVPPVERLFVSVSGSIGGVDYPYFRKDVIYTPNRVANDGIYTIPLFPSS